MLRALAFAAVLSTVPGTDLVRLVPGTHLSTPVPGTVTFQAAEGVLNVKVVITRAGQAPMAVPRHALLISDNPPTTTPRRVVTGIDGAVHVRLRPGNYLVESDAPFALDGKAYEWRQLIDVAAGQEVSIELTASNADVTDAAPGSTRADSSVEVSISTLLGQWQASVVALWTPTSHASGFVVDADGLIATNQRAIGASASVEVELSPEIKIAATVLAANPDKDVVVLRINPAAASSLRPVPLGCAEAASLSVIKDQEIVTIGSPLRETKGPSFGAVSRVDAHALATDLAIPIGSSGGPVFASGGSLVGLTSLVDDDENRRRQSARVVPIQDVCEVVTAARAKLKEASAPADARLPVEPSRPFPGEALKEAAKRRVGSLSPYQVASTDFDISFITPVMVYGAQTQFEQQMNVRGRGAGGNSGDPGPALRPLRDFGQWSEYVADVHPVLLVRVTPKLVEGFWTKVARGAAQTQGVSLPPFKRMRSGFSRMRIACGDAEVAPIHPLKIEQHVSGTETIYEGLYVFDPGALGPSCATVKVTVYSEKEPQKADTRVVDAKVIEQIWQDFAPYRTP